MRTKRFLSILLSLVLVLGMFPGMSLTASAADTTTTITSSATTGTMTITLAIAAASVKTAPEANTLTYSGSAQTLTTTGEAGVGTLQYQLGESATTEPTGTWGTTVPQGTEAKDYYVWYRSRVNDNNISTAGCKTVTIAKASITNATVTLSDTSLVYTGSEQSVTVSSVKLGDTTLTADTDYEVTSGTTGTAKNTYTVTVTGKGNYKDTATAQWSIGLATPTITTIPTASVITYGQKLADSILTGGTAKLGDNTVAGTFAWKNTETKPAVSDSDTTEYDVVFTPTDDDNYAAVECKVKLTVNKADPTNTVGQLSAIRGQKLADVALPTADNGAWSWVEDTTTTLENVGMATYHAKFTPNDTANYNTLENVEVEIQVAEKPSAVAATVTANNRTYDGSEKPLVNVDNSTLVGGEMQYALGTATEATQPYTTSIPTATNAGTYYVWYKVVGDGNYSDTEPKCITVTISPKEEPQTEPQSQPQSQPAPASQPQQPTSVSSEDFSLIMNSDFLVFWKGSKVMVRWGTVPGADSYEVYADYCGSHSIEKVLTVPGGNSTEIPLIDGKKPNPKNCVKAYVVAYRNGVPIGKTLQGHAAGRNYNATNVKRIKASKKTYKLALGKSKKLKIKTVKMKRRKKMIEKWHCDPLRYASSDETVATVTKKGKIKAVGKGSCEIWAYAQNGRSCKVTVVVK